MNQSAQAKIQNLADARQGRKSKILWLILAVFSALALYQSVALPLGEADDETDHYQYLRFVAHTGHPPLTEAERSEAGFKGGLAPLYYWLTAWPIAVVGEDSLPDIRRVDARPERHIPTDGLGFNHVLHTLDEQWPWRGQPLAWHLVRLLSLPMGWVTIIATYALARRLRPGSMGLALGAAGFVALLPRFVFSSAVINDDNLVFALVALLLLVQVIILQRDGPPSPGQMALFGALFGLALVVKYFSLILLPEVALTLAVVAHKAAKSQSRKNSLFLTIYFLLPLFLSAGLWFAFIALRFNRVAELGWIAGLAASLGEPQITEGLAGLLAGQSVRPVAATYSLPAWLGLLYRSFWFEFGWMNVFAPAWIYWLFGGFSLLALAGLTRKVLIHARRGYANLTAVHSLLGLHLALFIVVVLVRYVLSATIDTGQGRHLYPALPVIAVLIATGIYELRITNYELRIKFYVLGLLPIILFCLPALITLLPEITVSNSQFAILPRFVAGHYHTHPVTTSPPPLPAKRRLNLEFAPGLALIGFDAPATVAAGNALPVTLHWQAKREATADFLLELCLTGIDHVPAACWRGQFENGRYPARAWEAGDTLIDTVHLPIPACRQLAEQRYLLVLNVWQTDPTVPAPQPQTLALAHTFAPGIAITPTGSQPDVPQPAELWLDGRRQTGPAQLALGQSLTQLDPASPNSAPAPQFVGDSGATWRPAAQTPLVLPCAGGPAPFAFASHFSVDPTLPAGRYRPTDPALPEIEVQTRRRDFAPVTSTLTFSRTLAPLVLTAGGQTIDLTGTPANAPRLTTAGGLLPVSLRWQARRWLADPLVIALKLVDKDFAVGGQRIATLGDRYPNVLWAPGEVVDETYPLQIDAAAPPGLYRLELGLVRQDDSLPGGYENLPLLAGESELDQNMYPLTVRLLDPAHNLPPPVAISATVGDSIRLTGYEVNRLTAGSPVELALYWQSTAAPGQDLTVFTQLIGPDGQVWAQWDNPPQAGRYPTLAWEANDIVIDRYTLALREGAPPGEYRLLVGMYNPATGERLPASLNGAPQPDNAIELARLSITP
ncbi:MAG: hypothetical protein FOGNACKC_05336 [Anaerolineae bacterium]|nr:hypothetical protein [Anaerolineae bacterium]